MLRTLLPRSGNGSKGFFPAAGGEMLRTWLPRSGNRNNYIFPAVGGEYIWRK